MSDHHTLEHFKSLNLNLDMTRGKPAPEQLDLANSMLTCVDATHFKAQNGADCRNYGILDGLPEAKALLAPLLDAPAENVLIGGNASLALMHAAVSFAMLHALPGGEAPWVKHHLPIKFLCPVPGYDRHFAICNNMNIDMIPIPLTGNGPDMDMVEGLVKSDASIKGIWCVPKYANPTGEVYSNDVIERLAKMETKAADFRIFWDNAYAVHYLNDKPADITNILTACEAAGHGNRPFIFGSTSKITHAGAGISGFAASLDNLAWFKKHIGIQTIGYDKLNQLRHVAFFKNFDGLMAHMQKHADILKPKFDIMSKTLAKHLDGTDLATWTNPDGGYFITLYTQPGMAQKVVNMAGELGVKLTKAGATHPNGHDPEDRTIRLAPSLPSIPEIEQAMDVVAACIKVVAS